MNDASDAVEITFNNELPYDVVVYDSFSSESKSNYFGDLTELATVSGNQSAQVQPKHDFASVFIVANKKTDAPIARFAWLKIKGTDAYTVTQEDVNAMDQTFAFIEFLTKNPEDPLAKRFKKIIADQSSSTIVDDVGRFFAKQAGYKLVTFVTYMMGIASSAKTGAPARAHKDKPEYSLSRLAELMGGSWPDGFPDISISRYLCDDRDGSVVFWAEIDVNRLPSQGAGASGHFSKILGTEKILLNIVFHHRLDLGLFGTRLKLIFETISIPVDHQTTIKIARPTVSIDISPLFKFVVFGIKGTIPFDVYGKKFDGIATLTIDNLEAAVGVAIEGDHSSLPAPPVLKGVHFDEFGVGMGIFFEPAGYVVGLQGKFHIGEGSQQVALDDDTFAIVLELEEEVPNPVYGSFYVPKMDLATVLALFTDTETGIDVPVTFTDLSFVWSEDPLKPVALPDGSLSDMALGFSAAVDVLSFGFFGKLRLDISGGLTADLERSPIVFGEVLKITGTGTGVTIKVDAEGNPIRNNAIRNTRELQTVLKDAKEKTLVSAGGPVLKIQSTKAPFLKVSGKVSLFELADYGIEADIDTRGIRFDLDYGAVLSDKMQCTLADFHNFSGRFSFGIDRSISSPSVGSVSLGAIKLRAKISAHLGVKTTTKDVSVTAGGGFEFEQKEFAIPDFAADAHIAKITDLLSAIGREIEEKAQEIFGSVLSEAGEWAAWVGRDVIVGVEDMAPVLKRAFKQSLHEAVSIMRGVGRSAEIVAKGVQGAYKATSTEVAQAMKAAGYSANEVAQGLKSAYGLGEKGVAEALKGAGYIASDVGGALKIVYGGTAESAARALRAAGYGAEAVGSALRGTFTESAEGAAIALKAAGFGAEDAGKALQGTFTESAESAAKALRAAGYGTKAIAGVARNVFGASTKEAANVLHAMGIDGKTADGILKGVGYPASEVGKALKDLFNWVPHVKIPHVKHIKIPHVKI